MKVFNPKLASVMIATVLAGCSLAPTYDRPASPVPNEFAGKAANTKDAGKTITANIGWQDFFKDPRLLKLIDLGLQNNRDLRIAAKQVEAARASYGVTRSSELPTIGLSANSAAQKSAESLAINPSNTISRQVSASVGLTSFELDLFGRVRNQSEQAFQQYLATDEARQAAQINLVGQIASSYFTLRSYEEQLLLANKTLKAYQSTLALVSARYKGGVATVLDLNQAQTTVEAAKATIAALKRNVAVAKNALAVVIGSSIPTDLPAPATFDNNVIISKVPQGLSSDLLARRPDIRQAEDQLKGSYANIGAARAAFFPNISLTGLLGVASPQLASLFDSGNNTWSFAPSLSLPIFTAGRLQNSLDLAKIQKDIYVAQYEKSIQTAFQEVSDALAGEATYKDQLTALRNQQNAAYQSLNAANLRYKNGIDSFLQVASAQTSLFSVQQQVVQTGLSSILNRIELYKALGGGWSRQTVAANVPSTDGKFVKPAK